MNACGKTTAVVYGAILLLAVGCAKEKELPQHQAKQSPAPQQASQCVVTEGLVVSINGTKVNYPDSQKLNWVAAKESTSPGDSFGFNPRSDPGPDPGAGPMGFRGDCAGSAGLQRRRLGDSRGRLRVPVARRPRQPDPHPARRH